MWYYIPNYFYFCYCNMVNLCIRKLIEIIRQNLEEKVEKSIRIRNSLIRIRIKGNKKIIKI